MPACAIALVLIPAVLTQEPLDDPFANLGEALLSMADRAGPRELAGDPRLSADARLLLRLEALHEPVELGLIELWLPRRGCDERGDEEKLKRPRVWRDMAESAVAVQSRWYAQVGASDDDVRRRGEDSLQSLRRWAKRASHGCKLPQSETILESARELRGQFLWDNRRMRVVLAPSRAQFAALMGAAGVEMPNWRSPLWTRGTLRAANAYFTPTTLAFALTGGPTCEGDAPLRERELRSQAVLQSAAHAFSHQLSNILVPSAPLWFSEGLALRDCVAVAGGDETLCAGYSGHRQTALDDVSQSSPNFLVFTRIERSPYRTGGCRNLFVDELRRARIKQGYRIMDLDTSREGVVLAGPFLGDVVRMPDAVAIGPRGLKEGYAEFFRAYCAAFSQFLAEEELGGADLLGATLRELHRRGRVDPSADDAGLEATLRALTGKTLGASMDPDTDLEGAFDEWLRKRR